MEDCSKKPSVNNRAFPANVLGTFCAQFNSLCSGTASTSRYIYWCQFERCAAELATIKAFENGY